jgi:hypothetical protein
MHSDSIYNPESQRINALRAAPRLGASLEGVRLASAEMTGSGKQAPAGWAAPPGVGGCRLLAVRPGHGCPARTSRTAGKRGGPGRPHAWGGVAVARL